MRTVADEDPGDRQPGFVEVLLVGAAVVAVVAAAVLLTVLLPDDVEQFVYETPLAIAVLVAGTAAVLLFVSRRQGT
jgi:hypothetical protein